MIEEAYCSFEIAKLLKEKGFNERSAASYDSKGQLQEGYGYWNKTPIWYAAPTHQMAMAWLREVKIDIAIYPYGNYSSENYQFDVYKNRHLIVSKDDGYVTYEQAVEAALKYTLENLI